MNHTLVISLCIICFAAVAFAGCTGTGPGNPVGQVTPAVSETPVQEGHLVVTEQQNAATVYVNQSSVITVELAENPTTGYAWNLTTTPGLHVMNETYVPSDTTGKLVGSGGTHTWDISTVVAGEQKIQAVYKRPWEATTGNETTFAMTVVVAPA